MKRYVLALALSVFCVLAAQAQNQPADSLRRLVRTAQTDTTRSLLLAQFARAYLYTKPDSALLLAEKGLALANANHYLRGKSACLHVAGTVMSIIGNYAKALSLELQALKIAEALHDRTLLISINNALGVIYGSQADYQKARRYFFAGKRLAEQLADQQKINLMLLNLGDAYEHLNQLDSARYFTNKAFDLAVERKDESPRGVALNNLGNIFVHMQQPTVALANYHLSLASFVTTGNQEGLCETTLGMANAFMQLHQPDSALYYAKLSFRTAHKMGMMQRMLNASTFLSDYYKKQRQVDSAYVYLSAQLAAKDSIFSQEKSRQLQSLNLDEMLRQQEKQAALAEQQQEHQARVQYAFIALALSSFTVLFLLLSSSVLVSERWIQFFGALGLLLFFEFLNLLFHGYIAELTHHSPVLMLLALVALASLLIPLHHRIEHWVTQKMLARHKEHKLAAARKAAAWLAMEVEAES